MPSAGELLRSERLKLNRNLADIAVETCISSRYLQAIEADDTKILPGDFFHRSFIRQYASALGLDEAKTKQILDALEPAPEIDPIPALSLPQQIADVERQSRPLARVPARVAASLFLVVLAACSGFYAWWNRAQELSDPDSPQTVAQSVASAPAEPQAAPPTPTAQPPASPGAVPPSAEDPGKISVDLAATEKTWVSLSSSGRTVFRGILDASQTKNFALIENAKLLTGNAAGLDIRMNGRPLGPLGARGQVRVVLFSQNNYQILAPGKM